MTGPVTTEALVDRKALRKAILAAIPENVPLRGRYATAIMEQAVAPALQQVTAERDEARAEYERGLQHRNDLYDTVLSLRTSLAAAKSREATATSELARLRAEGEAKDRRIAKLEEVLAPFAKAGGLFGPRESNGWDVLIYNPAAGDEYCITADHLRAARAATAREGA